MVQIVGHSGFDERAHQGVQRLDVVVDALQEHALADKHKSLRGEAAAGGPRRGGKFARMIGVQGDDDRPVVCAQSSRHARGHAFRLGDRQARCQRSVLT